MSICTGSVLVKAEIWDILGAFTPVVTLVFVQIPSIRPGEVSLYFLTTVTTPEHVITISVLTHY